MEHAYFFAINFAIFIAILLLDRTRWKNYIALGLLAMLLDVIFEVIPIGAGIWNYYSEPKVFGMSLYTWLLYIPYLGFCYFASNVVRKHV